MFMDWINQMVAVLDKAVHSCVSPIITNIARSYPQALIYPLGVSKEQFSFDVNVEGAKIRKYIEE